MRSRNTHTAGLGGPGLLHAPVHHGPCGSGVPWGPGCPVASPPGDPSAPCCSDSLYLLFPFGSKMPLLPSCFLSLQGVGGPWCWISLSVPFICQTVSITREQHFPNGTEFKKKFAIRYEEPAGTQNRNIKGGEKLIRNAREERSPAWSAGIFAQQFICPSHRGGSAPSGQVSGRKPALALSPDARQDVSCLAGYEEPGRARLWGQGSG